MLNVYSDLAHRGLIYENINGGMLDYLPSDKFQEVFDIGEADILLMMGSVSSNTVDRSGQLSLSLISDDFKLENMENIAKISTALARCHRIFYLDTLGPFINRDKSLYDGSGLRDTDILLSPATLPERPNLYTNVWSVEKSLFTDRKRFDRVKGSIMISLDNLTSTQDNNVMPEIDILSELMDTISELHINKSYNLPESIEKALSDHIDCVSCEFLSYPKGVANKASQCEFILHMHTKLGAEYMGIEAGMAGCQPIYPDTEFYRDIFDGTGVVFYDVQNPIESLKSIISQGSTFTDEQIEAFREKFSAENTMPAFWDSVYDLYAPKGKK